MYEEEKRPNITEILKNPIFNDIQMKGVGKKNIIPANSTRGKGAEVLDKSRRDFDNIL